MYICIYMNKYASVYNKKAFFFARQKLKNNLEIFFITLYYNFFSEIGYLRIDFALKSFVMKKKVKQIALNLYENDNNLP